MCGTDARLCEYLTFDSKVLCSYLNELDDFKHEINGCLGCIKRMTHLLIAQIQELVELNTTVRERTERPLLLELSGEGGVGDVSVSLQMPSQTVSIFLPLAVFCDVLTILILSGRVLRRGAMGTRTVRICGRSLKGEGGWLRAWEHA